MGGWVNDACYRLGKTFQVIAVPSGMFDTEKIKSVKSVLPVAVIINWERELKKWWVSIRRYLHNNNTFIDTGSVLTVKYLSFFFEC